MDIPPDFYSLPVEYRNYQFDPTLAGKHNARRPDAATAIETIETIARIDGAVNLHGGTDEEAEMSGRAQRVASEELIKLLLRGNLVDFKA